MYISPNKKLHHIDLENFFSREQLSMLAASVNAETPSKQQAKFIFDIVFKSVTWN